MEINLGDNSKYINTGDWISHFTYAVFDSQELTLKTFKE
jgi:UDP-2,3-diacylglucosamine hydrolase